MRHASLFLALALALPAIAARADTPTPTEDATRNDATATPDGSEDDDAQTTRTLGTITVTGVRPTSLPTQIPTTMEGISGDEAEATINAIDAEDVLKYFPSLVVRKRYVGDFDHAVLATRASGTGNSARSLVYADGILLSNLLGNGASFTPRWGLVAPEEIARVDVLYGPFSAAYPGNSVGAVVDYVTRMPQGFEAHAKLSHHHQDFELYRTRDRYDSTMASASIGDRWGAFSAWLAVNRLDSEGHPMMFANLLQSSGTPSSGTPGSGTPVSGAVAGRNPRNQPWSLIGASSIVETEQEHAKLKLAYDFSDDLRLSYTFGTWRNDVFRDSETWLRDAAGNPVYSGNVLIDGRRYAVPATAISLQQADLEHRMHGLALKRSSGKTLDFTLAVSRYDYVRDRVRSPTVARPIADTGGAGRIADSDGTGWRSANAHLVWRPNDAHVVEFGVQDDRFTLDTEVRDTSDWRRGTPGARFSAFGGKAALTGAFAQDTWRWSERWTGTFGLRFDRWRAHDGLLANATTVSRFAERRETALSPKAALAFAFTPDTSLQASVGRAVRFPTVSELYQGSLVAGSVVNNDPDLKAERSTTSELSLVHALQNGRLRATVFHERTRDALYSQTNVLVTPNITNIQNVGVIRTTGVELAGEWRDLGIDGLELTGSVTFADSIIRENPNVPASEGKRQPRVPRWRANLLASYAPSAQWQFTAGARYSGKQFNTLDNSDLNGNAYTGTSPFFVMDLRARWRPTEHWGLALGVDNLNDRTYWNFHPYTQRTWVAELRYDWR